MTNSPSATKGTAALLTEWVECRSCGLQSHYAADFGGGLCSWCAEKQPSPFDRNSRDDITKGESDA